MSSKCKKSQSGVMWYTCDRCHCIIARRDVQEHESKDCSSTDSSESRTWNTAFIKDEVLYSFLEESKLPDDPNVAKDVVLISQSAMQLCQFVIGDYVTVQSRNNNIVSGGAYVPNNYCEVKLVWPTVEGSVTSVLLSRQAMELSWGLNYGPVIVSKLVTPPILASEIVFQLKQRSDIPEKIGYLVKVLQYQFNGRIFRVNNKVIVNFYGRKLKLIISNIVPIRDQRCNIDNISKDLNELNIESGIPCSERDTVKFYKAFEKTKWSLKSSIEPSSSNITARKPVTLNDIGGYKDIIRELQEFVCVKKSTTDCYKNIKFATGVLLYGLHGTGKSFIAQALANDSGARVINIHSGDLFSKFYGEAEARLQSLFKEALANAPSVIVLDDIDTICSKRNSSDQERRVMAMLLTSLDSLYGSDVSVIATTSQLHLIDTALRRPCRLDREVELPVPSQTDREDILLKMLKNENVLERDAVKRVAAIAHGYVGADLGAVVASAYARAVLCNSSTVTNFLDWALTQIKPSAMREVYVEVPNVKWSDIGGQDHLKLQLRQAVEWPLSHPEAFTRLGITPPHGVLMFGPPGCSKTMIAKALATESKLNFISIKGPELFSKWVGESERAVRAVFKRARSVAPSIVFLDELDALAGERGDGGAGGGVSVQERVLAQLLTELDGVEPLSNVTIIAATNRPDRIDKALLRPGRLDRLIYVPLPDLATRRQILELQFRKIPVASDVSVDELACALDKYSGAEVVAVCHEAALNALEKNYTATDVKLCNFKAAIQIVAPRTPHTLLNLYERYIA